MVFARQFSRRQENSCHRWTTGTSGLFEKFFKILMVSEDLSAYHSLMPGRLQIAFHPVWCTWYGVSEVQLEKKIAPCASSKVEIMSCNGFLFLMVILLRPQKSIQGWTVLFFLATKRNQPQGGIQWINDTFDRLYKWLGSKGAPGRPPSGCDKLLGLDKSGGEVNVLPMSLSGDRAKCKPTAKQWMLQPWILPDT